VSCRVVSCRVVSCRDVTCVAGKLCDIMVTFVALVPTRSLPSTCRKKKEEIWLYINQQKQVRAAAAEREAAEREAAKLRRQEALNKLIEDTKRPLRSGLVAKTAAELSHSHAHAKVKTQGRSRSAKAGARSSSGVSAAAAAGAFAAGERVERYDELHEDADEYQRCVAMR
jgi:hypothetical protein